MKTEISKELVFSYFASKASPLQRKLVEEWLKTNEEQYYEWLEEWENTHPQYLPDSEAALLKYEAFLENNPQSVEPLIVSSEETEELRFPLKPTIWWKWGMAAAMVVGVMTIGGWFFRDNIIYQTYQTTFGETEALTLKDGTHVTLNANSSLRIPRFGFSQTAREVFLVGEANFEVTHQANHQKFVVKTDKNFEVVVLGTEFTVYARQRISKVVLNKGKVKVQYQEGNTQKHLMMKPGDLVTLDNQNRLSRKVTNQPQNYAAWEQKRFVFEETTLQEVAYLLQENYGLEVEISSKPLAERVIMGSFRAENVDELLRSISELLDINVVRQGNRVQLTDK